MRKVVYKSIDYMGNTKIQSFSKKFTIGSQFVKLYHDNGTEVLIPINMVIRISDTTNKSEEFAKDDLEF